MRLKKYSDDRSTGQFSNEYRYWARAIISASIPESCDLEWIHEIKSHLPKGSEVKSTIVLPLLDDNNTLKKVVLDNVGCSDIIIIDFYENTRFLLNMFKEIFNIRMDITPNIIFNDSKMLSLSKKILSSVRKLKRGLDYDRAIYNRIKHYIDNISSQCDIEGKNSFELFNQDLLNEMNEQEFQELTARFSVAFSESVSINMQKDYLISRLEKILPTKRYFNTMKPSGGMSDELTKWKIEGVMSNNYIFDQGMDSVFDPLVEARTKIENILEEHNNNYFSQYSKSGSFAQEDSRRVLELQAADVAAAIASKIYEENSRDNNNNNINAVKKQFNNVFLNDEWIE